MRRVGLRLWWLPVVLLPALGVAIATVLGPAGAGTLLVGLALGVGSTAWLLARAQRRRGERDRDEHERAKLLRGGKERHSYDLSRDDSTDDQRWLM